MAQKTEGQARRREQWEKEKRGAKETIGA